MNERAGNCILGAFVADAATLGLHWLYDQERILSIASDKPEFRQPTKTDFDGTKGYFAHPDKLAGDQSQYGEQMLVMLRSLADNNGHYSKAGYIDAFQHHFGYGGEYTGYIDRPTRDTLNYLAWLEAEIQSIARTVKFNGDPPAQRAVVQQIVDCIKTEPADSTDTNSFHDLQESIAASVSKTHDEKILVDYAVSIANQLSDRIRPYPGADDTQLPALSKLPPVIVTQDPEKSSTEQLMAQVESAIRVTNNNDFACENGILSANLLVAAINGEPLPVIVSLREGVSSTVASRLDTALENSALSVSEVTAQYGLSCQLEYAMPSIMYNLSTTRSFEQGIRDNIRAGGDNCGRSILLGAVLGAHFGIGGTNGIPVEWLDRLNRKDEINSLLDTLNQC